MLAYSWLDESATSADPLDAHFAGERRDENGERLGTVLNEAIAPSFRDEGMVHVIGHSFGAKVATLASLRLERPPNQLTLLDSPESPIAQLGGVANDLPPLLRQLPLGRTPESTFVDSYYSEFGEPYGDWEGLEAVVDTHLIPSQYPITDVIARHVYPAVWYTDAAEHPDAGVGPQWSPLLGDRYERLEPSYRQAHPGTGPVEQLELEAAPRAPLPALESVFSEEGTELGFLVGGIVLLSVGVLGLAVTVARHRRARVRV